MAATEKAPWGSTAEHIRALPSPLDSFLISSELDNLKFQTKKIKNQSENLKKEEDGADKVR